MKSSCHAQKSADWLSAAGPTDAAPQRHDDVGGLEHHLLALVVNADLELHEPAIGVRARRPGLHHRPFQAERVARAYRPRKTYRFYGDAGALPAEAQVT